MERMRNILRPNEASNDWYWEAWVALENLAGGTLTASFRMLMQGLIKAKNLKEA